MIEANMEKVMPLIQSWAVTTAAPSLDDAIVPYDDIIDAIFIYDSS